MQVLVRGFSTLNGTGYGTLLLPFCCQLVIPPMRRRRPYILDPELLCVHLCSDQIRDHGFVAPCGNPVWNPSL